MLERGYVRSIDEAFDRYINRNGPAYVERLKVTPSEAVAIVRSARGVPVLAHPLFVSHLVPDLAAHGLAGLEAYYSGYSSEEIHFLLGLAARHSLVVTGGTDFHGGEVLPDNTLGSVWVPPTVVERLKACHERLTAVESTCTN
jgi:hypothetical protein